MITSFSTNLRKINSPYVFQILTKEKTKINISYDDKDGERKEDINIIAPAGELYKFVREDNIYFELWNSKQVDITINNNPIDEYLNEVDGLVRGEFNPTNKK